MKPAWLKQGIQACYLHGGLLALAVNLFLTSISSAQLDDTRIAFMSNRHDERSWEIYLMNSDGKRVRRLTEHPQADGIPAWSPDGQKIAFVSFRNEPRDIYVMNPDGTNLINLTQSPERSDSYPSWSPDGKQIVFSTGDIWVMDADGENQRNLTNHIAGDGQPDWSPDGRQIAFSSDRDRAWEFEGRDNRDIYVMNTDGTNPINLTNNPAWDSSPAWEPAPILSISSKGKLATLWGKVKRANTFNGK